MQKVLMLFPHIAEPLIDETNRGVEPRERLYGLIELRERGWRVDPADSRHYGLAGWIRKHFGWLVNPIDLQTVMKLREYDTLLVKDDFSLMAVLAGRMLGKKVIFLDAMFDVPTRFWRRWSARLCVHLAHKTIAFSSSQTALWVKKLGLSTNKLCSTSFSLDGDFYEVPVAETASESFVFAVGRDVGRDFQALIDAARGTDLTIELVTLPYLSDTLKTHGVHVRVFPRLSYQELFLRYAQARVAVIPLRDAITYPSGIRAVLEAMIMGTPVVATRTPVLEELFSHRQELLFVDPGDAISLRSHLVWILENADEAREMANRAQVLVRTRYNMKSYVDFLEQTLLA